jgi:electron transport complex protein RnfA
MSGTAHLATLAVFSSLSMNLLLRCGLGMRDAAGEEDQPVPFARMGLLAVSVLILWVFFSYILPLGFFAYLLLFPGSALVSAGLEQILFRLILKRDIAEGPWSPGCRDGLTAGALFLTLHLASGFLEAAVLSLGFALGTLLSLLILAEIRRRSRIEAVPPFLRGSPLALISMGLLSLIFSSAAVILYRAFGG